MDRFRFPRHAQRFLSVMTRPPLSFAQNVTAFPHHPIATLGLAHSAYGITMQLK
jgi:hypothetical protein